MTVMTDPYRLDDYELWLRGGGAAAKTVELRLTLVCRIRRSWPDPARVAASDVAAFLDGYEGWTRRTYYNHLRSLFGWLVEVGVVEVDPTARLRRPAEPQRRPRPLTVAEERRVLAPAVGDMRAWLLLGLRQGLRAHEIAKIHGRDVTERSLVVLGKGRKLVELPTHPDVWELALERPRDDYWFPGGWRDGARRPHLSTSAVTNAVGVYFRALGVDGSIHRCRASYGTSLVRAGVNLRVVQELMRHSSLATTEFYLGVDEDEKTAAIRLLGATQ